MDDDTLSCVNEPSTFAQVVAVLRDAAGGWGAALLGCVMIVGLALL